MARGDSSGPLCQIKHEANERTCTFKINLIGYPSKEENEVVEIEVPYRDDGSECTGTTDICTQIFAKSGKCITWIVSHANAALYHKFKLTDDVTVVKLDGEVVFHSNAHTYLSASNDLPWEEFSKAEVYSISLRGFKEEWENALPGRQRKFPPNDKDMFFIGSEKDDCLFVKFLTSSELEKWNTLISVYSYNGDYGRLHKSYINVLFLDQQTARQMLLRVEEEKLWEIAYGPARKFTRIYDDGNKGTGVFKQTMQSNGEPVSLSWLNDILPLGHVNDQGVLCSNMTYCQAIFLLTHTHSN